MVLLNKNGRKSIGLQKPEKFRWLLYALLLGIALGLLVYFLGVWLHGTTEHHWYVYIAKSYTLPAEALTGTDKHIYFAIFAVIGMTFSPIGEELLYRGLIHQSFVQKFGQNYASVIDSLAFAVVHLAHFGILYTATGWQFPLLPALLWMAIIFFTGRLFFYCKQKTGAIYGAMACHAGFNLGMTYTIFYYIL